MSKHFASSLCKALIPAVLASLCFSAQAETIRVGTHPTFAPFEYSEQGKIVGFDLDVISAVAKANGDSIIVESMPFDGLIPSLLTGNIDLIISGMTITDARKQRVDFSKGYYDSNLSMLVHKDKVQEYESLEALKGKTICVQIGTTGHAFADKVSPGNVKALNNQPDALLELNNGGCEALINDRPVNLFYLQKAKLENIVDVVNEEFTKNVDSYGIAVRKGNTKLLNKINTGLQRIEASGELDRIHLKWFGTKADTVVPSEATAKEQAVENKENATKNSETIAVSDKSQQQGAEQSTQSNDGKVETQTTVQDKENKAENKAEEKKEDKSADK